MGNSSGGPTGAGVKVTQIEAAQGSASQFFINLPLSDFAGKTIIDATGGGTTSNHATNVAQNFYGNFGVAPGVTNIKVYNADDWLGNGFLRTRTSQAPRVETQKVLNNSWIANFTDTFGNPDTVRAIDVLRRLDYVITRDQVVSVVGVNNGTYTTLPQVLANSYNSIAVGIASGNSSTGGTTLEGLGRAKPDIVAPAADFFPSVSVATSWVSGAAAQLLEAGAANSDAQRPEVVKALLMAGAVKTPFDLVGATASTLDDWSRTAAQPLDLRYGAGQLHIDNGLAILAAGQQGPAALSEVNATGWNHDTLGAGATQTYYFTVPANKVAFTFSLVAAWNRQIAFTPGVGINTATLTPQTLANLTVELNNSLGFSGTTLVDESISTIDNVQHLYDRALPAGQYEVVVHSNLATDYALAWQSKLVTVGDGNGDGAIDGLDYILWADHFGQHDVGYWNGDYDQNGVVDGLDYLLWADGFGFGAASFPNLALSTVAAVPEPATLTLALMGAAIGLAVAARRRRGKRR
ncbi:MAG: PEP-CTERM sorting domain-containing protein [Pirellulales bacterium]